MKNKEIEDKSVYVLCNINNVNYVIRVFKWKYMKNNHIIGDDFVILRIIIQKYTRLTI